MVSPRTARLVWLVCMVILLPAAAFGLAVVVQRPELVSSPAFLGVMDLIGVSAVQAAWLGFVLPTVLAFIVAVTIRRRRPNDPNALLFGLAMVGLFLIVDGVGTALETVIPRPAALLVDVLAVDLTILGLYLFPNGRFVPRWTIWPALLFIVSSWVFPDLTAAARAAGTGTPVVFPGWLTNLVSVLAFLTLATWLPSQVYRYRHHSTPLERLQTRWVLFGFSLIVFGGFGAILLRALGSPTPAIAAALLAAAAGSYVLPVATGFAVLRYRLYEIDRIISRTVTYAVVAGLLAGLYTVIVFGLTRLLPATGDLAVAGSTLAVAGLFNPLRHRVQQLVDRRFNRSRYDAEVLIDSFSTRLRSGINLSDVLDDLRSVLARTVEPDSTMIWVRRSLG
ncbi:MAG TPA: hypothetical protein VIB78_03950 [Acidimicrobiia bacterium]|jgi:hypothetical protein